MHLAEVEALEHVGLVHRAVAEVRHRHAPGRPLQRQGRPRGCRDAAADDPERADQAVAECVDVHRAGPSAVDARLPAEHLVEQQLRVDPERESVPVPAVGRGHAVPLLEQARHSGRHGLLPRVQVRRAVDLALQEQRLDEVLEPADEQHLPVDPGVEVEVVEDPRRRLVADVAHVTPTPASEARRSER